MSATKGEIAGCKNHNCLNICKYIIAIYFILAVPQACSDSGEDITEEKGAKFNFVYSDFGKDINMNELYDFIAVTVGIDVLSPGEYKIKGSLLDASGDEILNASNSTYLNIGIKSIQLDFQGAESGGKRSLKNLTLYDSAGNEIDHIDDAYTTRADYDRFDRGPRASAWLTGNYSEHGIDANGDGLYDYLALDVGTFVQSPGDYTLMAYLFDQQGRELIWAIDHREISKGDQTMHLIFDGRNLRSQKANGPYNLRNVTLSSGSSYTRLDICDHVKDAYTTSAYNYSAFKK